jgi:hypothetical protein
MPVRVGEIRHRVAVLHPYRSAFQPLCRLEGREKELPHHHQIVLAQRLADVVGGRYAGILPVPPHDKEIATAQGQRNQQGDERNFPGLHASSKSILMVA